MIKQCGLITTVLLFTLAAGMIIGSCNGCNNKNGVSSTQPVLQPVLVARDAHDVYDLIVSGLTTLKQMGVLTTDDKAKIEPIRVKVYDAIVKMDKAALEKNSAEFFSARQAYDLALPSLREWLISKQKKSTTQPVRIEHAGNRDGNFGRFAVRT